MSTVCFDQLCLSGSSLLSHQRASVFSVSWNRRCMSCYHVPWCFLSQRRGFSISAAASSQRNAMIGPRFQSLLFSLVHSTSNIWLRPDATWVDDNTGEEMCADECGGFWWDSSNLSEMFELLMMQETFFPSVKHKLQQETLSVVNS